MVTDRQWETVALLLDNCWAGEFDEDRSKAYRVMLGDFDADAITLALRQLAENDRPFMPTVPEIITTIRGAQDPSPPAWTEIWATIRRALGTGDEVAARALLEDFHPFVAAFVAAEGFDRLRMMPFDDPAYGQLRVAELGKRWTEFLECGLERVKRGRAFAALGRSGAGPQRLDASAVHAAVGAPPKQLPAGDA